MKTRNILRRYHQWQARIVTGHHCGQNGANMRPFGIPFGPRAFSVDATSGEIVPIASEPEPNFRGETCARQPNHANVLVAGSTSFSCGISRNENEPLPPPLPEPIYSVHKRVLPSSLTAFSSPAGRKYLIESIVEKTAESYWALTEQFVNQSDPAFCGITTLLMVSRSCFQDMKLSMDPANLTGPGFECYVH